jgi:hypothetical protein
LNNKGSLIVADVPEKLPYLDWVNDCGSMLYFLSGQLLSYGLRWVVVSEVVDNGISE